MEIKLGQVARNIRVKKGIKQSFISKKLGFKHQSSYSDIEKGRRNLSVDKVPILAKALGVSVEDLFFEQIVLETRSETESA